MKKTSITIMLVVLALFFIGLYVGSSITQKKVYTTPSFTEETISQEQGEILPVYYNNLRYSYLRGAKSIVIPGMTNDIRCMPIHGAGKSMEPVISSGNTLLRIPFDRKNHLLHKGAIVDFDLSTDGKEGSVAHQVIEVRENGVITKGFNNNKKDTFIPYDHIKCIVVGVLYTNKMGAEAHPTAL
jgi:hypothetical protein